MQDTLYQYHKNLVLVNIFRSINKLPKHSVDELVYILDNFTYQTIKNSLFSLNLSELITIRNGIRFLNEPFMEVMRYAKNDPYSN